MEVNTNALGQERFIKLEGLARGQEAVQDSPRIDRNLLEFTKDSSSGIIRTYQGLQWITREH